jgi:hypothetical protein
MSTFVAQFLLNSIDLFEWSQLIQRNETKYRGNPPILNKPELRVKIFQFTVQPEIPYS